MSDRDTSGSAPETAPVRDFNPNDMQAIADSLPDHALDFEDGDTEDTSEGPQEPRQPRKPRREAAEEPQDGGEAPESDDEPSEDEAPADEAPADDDAEGEGEGEGEAEKPAEASKDKTPVFVEIDGHNIPIDEVRKGFLRQADYSRKTMALAEESRQTQALRQQTEAERGELGNILNIAIEVIRGRMPAPPDKSMIRADPVGYMEQLDAYNDATAEVQKLLGAQQEVGQRQTADERQAQEAQQRQTAEALQREQAAMLETIPELRTPEGQQAFRTDALEHGAHYGLKAEDIAGIQDHRALRVLKDAIAYRKLQAAKPAAMERVKSAPPIRPATRQAPGTRSGETQKRAMDRLRREGTIEAAAATLDDALFD